MKQQHDLRINSDIHPIVILQSKSSLFSNLVLGLLAVTGSQSVSQHQQWSEDQYRHLCLISADLCHHHHPPLASIRPGSADLGAPRLLPETDVV